MPGLGLAHFLTALVAIVAGGLVVAAPKGTRYHRWVGRVYFAAMLVLNVTALLIYRLWGHFGPFHAAALVSLVTVVLGVVAVRRRKPAKTWRIGHAYWMSWSYVGLLAAAVAETSTRLLNFNFGLTVAVASFAVLGVGAVVINRRLPVLLGLKPNREAPMAPGDSSDY